MSEHKHQTTYAQSTGRTQNSYIIISRFGCPCPIQRANKSDSAVHQLCRFSLCNVHIFNSCTTYFIRTGNEVNIGTAQEPVLILQVTSRLLNCHICLPKTVPANAVWVHLDLQAHFLFPSFRLCNLTFCMRMQGRLFSTTSTISFLLLQSYHSSLKVVRHWNRLPREAVDTQSLEELPAHGRGGWTR